jgi:hypothetical protein
MSKEEARAEQEADRKRVQAEQKKQADQAAKERPKK